MCNRCLPDPRDDLQYGATALRRLADLVSDLRASGGRFESTQPTEFAELLDMVANRIDRAADGMQFYVSRDWKPPTD
jgi:hypothetical protein